MFFFFFSSRRRHTRLQGDWSSDVCSSDLSSGNREPGMANEELIYRITRAIYARLGAGADESAVEQLVTDIYRAVEPELARNGAATGSTISSSRSSFGETAASEGSANRLIISVFGVDHPGIVAGVS